ncbi:hypothetical protein [Gloeobacter kilaueensis]|uniref:Uncharacterized protein n=1 Tax=Gloeobacter kilaueensis (strain ATCC BAA-2537 / CCAP 1431/1 / ULC 316 / JS1) TaxID=1183438 RepID=U5QLN3_GLOK1|nr:hypothetical protein [Gloeobacter kilaueensis]AGY58524.1 hypothetical protein GKIL_2278 [Gloeobacter kilaueensis JS1]
MPSSIKAIALLTGLVLTVVSPLSAQERPPSPIAPSSAPTTPSKTLPEIVPCDGNTSSTGAPKDKIAVTPPADSPATDRGAVVKPPFATKGDRGAVISPDKQSGMPDNLPKCTLPAQPSQPK